MHTYYFHLVQPKKWCSISKLEERPGEHIEREFISSAVANFWT